MGAKGGEVTTKVTWDYCLNVMEEKLAAQVGWARQSKFLGQPQRNQSFSEGDVWETMQHMIAVGSEIALAKMLGMDDFVPHCDTFKSKSDLPGNLEVRYAFPIGWPDKVNMQRGLRITTRDKDESLYILMSDGLCHKSRRIGPEWLGNPYHARGWMTGREAKDNGENFDTNTRYVQAAKLRPMDTLVCFP